MSKAMIVETRSFASQPQCLRLFRGEGLTRLSEIRREGLRGREPFFGRDFPGLRRLEAESLPHELVPDVLSDVIYQHVTKGSHDSPFVSFSTDRAIAKKFSRGPDGTQKGFVMGIDVQVCVKYSAQAFPQFRYGSFTDNKEHPWIWIEGCNVGTKAILDPVFVSYFQGLGRTNREYLVLGDIQPGELRIPV